MAQDDPFTLDVFGNTALTSGLGLGVTAFAGDITIEPEDDDDPDPSTPAPAIPIAAVARASSPARQDSAMNFHLAADRALAKGWKDRARDNITAIRLAAAIEAEERPATPEEQEQLVRFTGFGASALANFVFRRPGEPDFRKGWEAIGEDLEEAVGDLDHASLARCTQYAHFTPEFIVRAIWSGLQRLGWRGGRVLEPGIGTGLFPALMPAALREASHVTGIELDPVTARIVRLLQPRARIIAADFARTELPASFDLAVGNPPFSDRTVRSDRAYRSLGLRLHDYFIIRSIDLLKPGALAAFVTSSGTMDKADGAAREHIAKSADLIAAIRLPEGSFRAQAGTDVVVDILFFRKRKIGDAEGDLSWLDLDDVRPATEDEGAIRVNHWFARHPDFVLGTHALAAGPFGETYTCRPREAEDLDAALSAAIALLPDAIYDGEPDVIDPDLDDMEEEAIDDLPSNRHVREGSYFFDQARGLMQVVDGGSVLVKLRKGRSADGIPEKHLRIIRKLIPIRDAVREVLKCQEFDRPWKDAQVRLRIAWSNFVRDFGPVNFTTVSMTEDEETGEVRETHRRSNLQPFLDDPDCWLVASIEDYDLETNTAKPGPIFTERVVSPPAPPVITSAADALAVVLNERGRVDVEHIAELLHRDVEDVIVELGSAIFRDPAAGSWQTADAYLSGHVRDKLKTAEAAAALDSAYERNVTALQAVQPADLSPSDITARLGAPWIPAADIVAFVHDTMGAEIKIHHMPELASWTVEARQLGWMAAGTSEWGTDRRHAGELLTDALNSRVPQIFDTIIDQIIVDEAQEFRKLSFATNMSTLKGVDPNGSQRAWDLFVKSRFVETRNPGRALVLASGTPITNTLGEMFSVQRYLGYAALLERGLHEFDAWASTFGDVSTELELQPSGKYKPVTRFATFVNVPELIAMFRSFADVVMPEDLRQYVKVPAISTGKRQILTAKPSAAFKRYQTLLGERIKAIEERDRAPEPGDDILLSVITDGRHAAIDLRLVDPDNDNEADNKLNQLVGTAFRIWSDTSENTYVRSDGKPFELPGAAQMIFSDLGTISVEKSRGFSAYRWIRDELVRMGVPTSEIAFMQDYKKSDAKQRLFGDVRAGKVRFLIGSSDTMGTGVNAQLRLKALHHLDVPWLPSQIEQREGRIVRQGNQHDEVDIYAYATEGSLDAQMWQNNERKARFIAAALSGDTSIRRLEDMGESQANQFAMAKAIASGDPRLMQKAGLEADIARLERLRAAHIDDQHAVRRQIRDAERDIEFSTRRIDEIGKDIARRTPTSGDAFAMTVTGESHAERKLAGRALLKEILTLVQLQQEGETVIASIGGFDVAYSGERFGRDGYRYTTMLLRTGAEYEIELPVTVTPLGAIARLEHALDDFEGERERYRQRLADARRRLASYESRDGGEFAFAGELADKRRQLAEVEKALAEDDGSTSEMPAAA